MAARGIKLTRNGNATTVCIPVKYLEFLRWRAGDQIIIEITDSDRLVVRRPRAADLNVSGSIGVIDGRFPEAAR